MAIKVGWVLVMVAIGLSACGGDAEPSAETPRAAATAPADPEAEVTRVVRDYFNALSLGDARRACGRLSSTARTEAIAIGKAYGARTCEEAIEGVADLVDAEDRANLRGVGVREISVHGDTANAVAVGANREVTLVLTNGKWEILALTPIEK